MPVINDFGTIKTQKPTVRRLTVEAECDSDISYKQLEKVVKKLKKNFNNIPECKISLQDNIHVVLREWQNPVKKTLFEEYISG